MAKPVITDKPIEVSDTDYPSVKAAAKDIAAKAGIYKLQIDANAIRVDHILLENVKDSVVSKGFKNEEAWAEIVQDTDNLFMKLDDFEMSPEDFDEDGLETIKTMIGSSSVICSQLMIDTESDVKKLRFVDVLAEEWCNGLKPFDVICAIEYDGVMATLQDPDVAEESGTNIFIKTSKNPLPAKAFDFTNGEKM